MAVTAFDWGVGLGATPAAGDRSDPAHALDLPVAPPATGAAAQTVLEACRGLARAQSDWLMAVAELDATDGWLEPVAGRGWGAGSTAGWLRQHCLLSPRDAAATVHAARRLAALRTTTAALAEGAVSVKHAEVVASAVDETARRVRHARGPAAAEQVAVELEDILLTAARSVHPVLLRRIAARAQQVIDPASADERAERAYAARRLHVSPTIDGTVAVDGALDPEGGAVVLAALDSLVGPPGPEDTRTRSQACADALVELARRALDSGDLPTTGGRRPHLVLTVDLDTLSAHRSGTRSSDFRPGGPAGGGPDDGRVAHAPVTHSASSDDTDLSPRAVGPGDDRRCDALGRGEDSSYRPRRHLLDRGGRATAVPELDWTGPVPTETARRVACDATITRILTDRTGLPLDVGQAFRTVPPHLRTALALRDNGCIAHGCTTPHQWCDAHHVLHWIDGGPTSLDNLVLLCRTHHRHVHQHGWAVRRRPDGRYELEPP